METAIALEGGEYAVLHDNGANLRAYRYGAPWRDLTGDGLVLALVQRIEDLEAVGQAIRHKAFEDVLALLALKATPQELLDYCAAEFDKTRPGV